MIGGDGGHAVIPPSGPALGLATTRQLLDELRARGECDHTGDPLAPDMAAVARHLMGSLSPVVLDYRTVDEL